MKFKTANCMNHHTFPFHFPQIHQPPEHLHGCVFHRHFADAGVREEARAGRSVQGLSRTAGGGVPGGPVPRPQGVHRRGALHDRVRQVPGRLSLAGKSSRGADVAPPVVCL